MSIAGVTDPDNVSATNPTGAITGQIPTFGRLNRPGTGVFEDIILLPAGDLAFQSADGTTFRVTPDLAGLSLRVKAIYEDAHGVTEMVFSAPTAPGHRGPARTADDAGRAGPTSPRAARAFTWFGLTSTSFSSRSRSPRRTRPARPALASCRTCARPSGLRTVDGVVQQPVELNGVDQSEFGAADNVFPRLTDPIFRNDRRRKIVADGLRHTRPTSYAQTSGNVFDSHPRTICNLIVDQTANNPAAYASAYDPGWTASLRHGPTTC